jgi:ABC-type dipeptide/oligopeptide/nickel transport system permease subunit
MRTKKPRRTPKAFVKRYGRLMIGGFIIGIFALMAIFAPFIATHDPDALNLAEKHALPNAEHILGCDAYGRDLFSRLVYGARTTMGVALLVQILTIAISATCGLLAGYYRKVDMIMMRVMEVIHAIPQTLLALVIASVLGPGVGNLMIALVVCHLPGPTRYVRAQVLSLRKREFVESEKAMGASDARTIFLHIMPHCSSYLLLRFSSGLGGTVSSLSTLAYLGVGMDPSIPNWGAIISDGNSLMFVYPHLVVSAGIAISLTIFGFCMLGDGLRDVLDPKMR